PYPTLFRSNLVFVFPVAMLAAITEIRLMRWKPATVAERAPSGKSRKKKTAVAARPVGPPVWRAFVLPIIGLAIVFVIAAPLQNATTANFYLGVGTIAESLRDLAAVSVLYAPFLRGLEVMRDAVAFVVAPGILIAGLVAGWRRRDVLL